MPLCQGGVEYYSDSRNRTMADGRRRYEAEGCQRRVRRGQGFCWQHRREDSPPKNCLSEFGGCDYQNCSCPFADRNNLKGVK